MSPKPHSLLRPWGKVDLKSAIDNQRLLIFALVDNFSEKEIDFAALKAAAEKTSVAEVSEPPAGHGSPHIYD